MKSSLANTRSESLFSSQDFFFIVIHEGWTLTKGQHWVGITTSHRHPTGPQTSSDISMCSSHISFSSSKDTIKHSANGTKKTKTKKTVALEGNYDHNKNLKYFISIWFAVLSIQYKLEQDKRRTSGNYTIVVSLSCQISFISESVQQHGVT